MLYRILSHIWGSSKSIAKDDAMTQVYPCSWTKAYKAPAYTPTPHAFRVNTKTGLDTCRYNITCHADNLYLKSRSVLKYKIIQSLHLHTCALFSNVYHTWNSRARTREWMVIKVKHNIFNRLSIWGMLAHLSRRLEWAIAVRFRPSCVNCLYFHLLLDNAWLDFNQTWQESSLGIGDSKLIQIVMYGPHGGPGGGP